MGLRRRARPADVVLLHHVRRVGSSAALGAIRVRLRPSPPVPCHSRPSRSRPHCMHGLATALSEGSTLPPSALPLTAPLSASLIAIRVHVGGAGPPHAPPYTPHYHRPSVPRPRPLHGAIAPWWAMACGHALEVYPSYSAVVSACMQVHSGGGPPRRCLAVTPGRSPLLRGSPHPQPPPRAPSRPPP